MVGTGIMLGENGKCT